jgi:transcriptional regulator with XRE-family HTH domain
MMKRKFEFQRLIKKSKESRVQGLYIYMFFNNKTMKDVQSDTGISRQTLSAWKKGQNVTHVNIEKIAKCYSLNTASFFDAKNMIEELIKNESDSVIRANLGAYLAEFSYLQNAHAETPAP